MHACRIADRIGQRVGAFGAAIDDDEFADARIEQRMRRRARGAARAEQQAAAFAQVESVAAGQVANQARAIGVVAAPVAVIEARERVHRSGALGKIGMLHA